jgi:hypothetical protein
MLLVLGSKVGVDESYGTQMSQLGSPSLCLTEIATWKLPAADPQMG